MTLEIKETSVNRTIGQMGKMGHEQLVFCSDLETGLKAIIAIHDTTLGPALGGTRMWNYQDESEALNDVLRLSRGMTYKASISGLQLGGGKAVIIGDADIHKTSALVKKFGEYVDNLGGRYITAKDVGMDTNDMKDIRSVTKHVTGIPKDMGGSGDPSPLTAYGVFMGMKASAKFKWGTDQLSARKIIVQGVGHVGSELVRHLVSEGAEVYITDINEQRSHEVSEKYDVKIKSDDFIYDNDIDIYSPCALGATLDTNTIENLKCEIIAGAANNQLNNEDIHSKQIRSKGIIYAPDFLINAGGLINVYSEIKGYTEEEAIQKADNIYETTLEILLKSETDDITTHESALSIAKQRIVKSK